MHLAEERRRLVKAPSITQKVVAVVAAAVLLLLSSGLAWAAANDYRERAFVPQGVSVNGTDLGGMTEAEARTAIEQAVAAPLMRPLDVTVDSSTVSFDPQDAVRVDVESMLDQAYGARRKAAFVARVRHDVAHEPLTAVVRPQYSVDATAVHTWLTEVASTVDRRAVNATITVSDGAVKLRPSGTGRKTAIDDGVAKIVAAFSDESALSSSAERAVVVPVAVLKPKVTEKDLGKTIVVDLSERRIRLYDGAKIEKTYPCAIGTPDHPTPKGHFEIVLKRYLPTWVNPAPNSWGKDMPPSIPPGPGNPLGTRAINLSASGIRFHGTTNLGSIGSAASHGCMRMVRADVEDLYERVKIGDQVYIVP